MFCKNCNLIYDDNKSFCIHCGAPLTPNPQPFSANAAPAPQPNHLSSTYTSVSPAPVKRKGKGLLVLFIILTILFFAGTIVGTVFAITNAMDAEYYRKQYHEYSDLYNSINDEYDFYHKHAVLCDDYEDDPYFHTHECEEIKKMEGYWIFNKEYALGQGYKPCPKCIK